MPSTNNRPVCRPVPLFSSCRHNPERSTSLENIMNTSHHLFSFMCHKTGVIAQEMRNGLKTTQDEHLKSLGGGSFPSDRTKKINKDGSLHAACVVYIFATTYLLKPAARVQPGSPTSDFFLYPAPFCCLQFCSVS